MSVRRYHVQTFGCQMNVHDSERIEDVLEGAGYEPATDERDADVIVVNTCSVREKAEHKMLSLVGRFRELKEARPELRVVAAGCVAQQEGEKLLKKSDLLDVILGPDNIPELPGILKNIDDGAPRTVRTVFDEISPSFLMATPRSNSVSAFVTVMKGCDERCTYCVVPNTRGPERYRPADDIVEEIKQLVDSGVREITLLGQTVNSWYDPSALDEKPTSKRAPSGSRFALLLRRIAAEVPNLQRLRYTSPHPRHLTQPLIAAHAELSILPRHMHLPVQSGSDGVLRRMSRRYTAEEYLKRVNQLKSAVPGLTLSTDLIVGFPGETEEDFLATLELVRNAGFVSAFAFKYSERPDTPAIAMGDDVTNAEKSERLQRLFEVVGEQQRTHLKSLVGTTTKVLVESESGGRFSGRSERHEIVHVQMKEGENPIGEMVEATIIQAFDHSLLAAGPGVDPATVPSRAPKARTKLPVVGA